VGSVTPFYIIVGVNCYFIDKKKDYKPALEPVYKPFLEPTKDSVSDYVYLCKF